MLTKQDAIDKMNELGKAKIPFLFIIDFLMQQPLVFRLNEIPSNISFTLNNFEYNNKSIAKPVEKIKLTKKPVDYSYYLAAFNQVIENLKYGNSYLINLTQPTKIQINLTLEQIYYSSSARYKLLFDDHFVVFSPEIFVQIIDGCIYSFPMKGTIDASIKDAADVILNDPKETAEHYTIVDLIRNDLSMVSKKVEVKRFRYIETINTNEKKLLQVSSEIKGQLPANYNENLGNIVFTLLPAGSVSGAPKQKTVEIINQVENYNRNYYTGVFGYFDGKNLDSGVMIRFIEKNGDDYIFKSGGGITLNSNPLAEYNELIDKVYVPIS
jgi:para-aminobenzoate synthetase component 1